MMKNHKQVGITAVIIAIFIFQPKVTFGQISDIGLFLKAGKKDAKILAKAYLRPLSSGIGGGLNAGWTMTPTTHGTLGFTIQVHATLAFVPETAQSFDIRQLPLSDNVKVSSSSPTTISPTIAGTDEPGPELVVSENGEVLARFNMPQGAGVHFVPAPMLQASLGIIKKTAVIVRYVPEVEIGDYGRFKMFGVGLKHEISQWIPMMPVDISILAGYSNVDISAPLQVEPPSNSTNSSGKYKNQKAVISFDTFTAKIIVGKSLPFINVYGALGYETSTMTAALKGTYPVPVNGPGGTTGTVNVMDPFKFSIDGENTYSFTGGVTLKLGFFHLFGQYTFAKYNVATAGIGFSFR